MKRQKICNKQIPQLITYIPTFIFAKKRINKKETKRIYINFKKIHL